MLEQMGATVQWTNDTITVSRDPSQPLKGVDVDCGDIPDAAMTLAVRRSTICFREVDALVIDWLECTHAIRLSRCLRMGQRRYETCAVGESRKRSA